MNAIRIAIILAVLMAAAGVVATVARPNAKVADVGPRMSLEAMVPGQFGDWHEVPLPVALVVNPQTQELLDKIYSQILTRVYVNTGGYRIMLSIAYGSDQRGALQAHKPEICYPSQGFNVHQNEPALVTTAYGSIPVRRLFATMGARQEPVTYWFTVGDRAVQGGLQKKLVEIRYGLTGQIPDGLLFRVSSIDGDQRKAQRMQDQFVDQLLQSMPPADRLRLSGLGG